MPRFFYKTKECGCIIKTIDCGKNADKILIGGHTHYSICNKCQIEENKGHDTLHDMWLNDNVVTDEWSEIIP